MTEIEALKKAVWDMHLILSMFYNEDRKAAMVLNEHAALITRIKGERRSEQ